MSDVTERDGGTQESVPFHRIGLVGRASVPPSLPARIAVPTVAAFIAAAMIFHAILASGDKPGVESDGFRLWVLVLSSLVMAGLLACAASVSKWLMCLDRDGGRRPGRAASAVP